MVALYAHLTALLAVIGKRFADKTKGATAVEYGLMVAGIAVAVIVIVFTLGDEVARLFTQIQTKLASRP